MQASLGIGGCFHHKGPDPHCCLHSILLQYFILVILNSDPCRGGAGVTERKGKGRKNWGSVSWLFPFSAKTVSWCLRAARVALEVKNAPADTGDATEAGSIPGLGGSPRGRNGNPLQCSCLENPWTEEPGSRWSIVSQRAGSRTRLKQLSTSDYLTSFFFFSF